MLVFFADFSPKTLLMELSTVASTVLLWCRQDTEDTQLDTVPQLTAVVCQCTVDMEPHISHTTARSSTSTNAASSESSRDSSIERKRGAFSKVDSFQM